MNDPIDVVTITLNPAIDRTFTIQNFATGKINRVEHERSWPAGKGVNVAAVLADYGHKVAVTGFLGAENAVPFEALFYNKKLIDRFVRIEGRTRLDIKITDPILEQTTHVNSIGLAPAMSDFQPLSECLDALIEDGASWFVIAGSIPPAVDPQIYRQLIQKLKSVGATVLLDTGDEPLRHGLESVPDIVKVKVSELEIVYGETLATQNAIVSAAQKVLANGVKLVVVSKGKEGACFATAEEIIFAHPPDIQVVSSVGASDALTAGIVAAHLRNLPLAQTAQLATAFSVDALSRVESGSVSVTNIDELMNQVTCSKFLTLEQSEIVPAAAVAIKRRRTRKTAV
jgi:1-phosphofructokinase